MDNINNNNNKQLLSEKDSAPVTATALMFMQYFNTLKEQGLSPEWAFKAALDWQQQMSQNVIAHIKNQGLNQAQYMVQDLIKTMKKQIKGDDNSGIFNDGGFKW